MMLGVSFVFQWGASEGFAFMGKALSRFFMRDASFALTVQLFYEYMIPKVIFLF